MLSTLWSWTPDLFALARSLRFYLWGALMVAMLMLAAARVPEHLRMVRAMVLFAASAGR